MILILSVGGSDNKESTCSAGDLGLTPGLGRSPGEGHGITLQYSGLENSVDWIFLGFPVSLAGKESACNARDPGLILGLGRSPGEGIDYHSSILGLPWWLRQWRICLQCGRPAFNPWVAKIRWRRACNPLHYSSLENSMDRGAWGGGVATIHRVTKSQTRLSK